MRLSEIKGDAAIELMANIAEPIARIAADEELQKMQKAKIPMIKIFASAVRNHKKEVLEILAYLDGEDPETYEISAITLPKKLMEIVTDPEIQQLF